MTGDDRFRFAVLTDIHVGSTRAGGWHNRFLRDDPEQTLAEAVESVNQLEPHLVLVLGDLSDTASAAELERCRAVLDGLSAPWLVCQGNHDVTVDGDSSAFEATFGDRSPQGRVPRGTVPLPDNTALVLLRATWETVEDTWRILLPNDARETVTSELATDPPARVLIACHFPAIRQSAYLRDVGGKNAGTIWNGDEALQRFAAMHQRTIWLSGHQHFHHIASDASSGSWLHCTTASLVEYPAEVRTLDFSEDTVRIATHAGAPKAVAAVETPDVLWVRGRPQDRDMTWRLA